MNDRRRSGRGRTVPVQHDVGLGTSDGGRTHGHGRRAEDGQRESGQNGARAQTDALDCRAHRLKPPSTRADERRKRAYQPETSLKSRVARSGDMSRLKGLHEPDLGTAQIERFHHLVEPEMWDTLQDSMSRLKRALRGHTLWNVNSTARVGGVAELLGALIPYGRGAGIDERWVVIEGSPAFFAVTKKLHTLLHGVRPDGADLSDAERREYERALAPNAEALLEEVRPGDVAILHDPQTAGLAPTLREHGVRVVWRSHIGVDEPNAIVREAWSFLRPYLAGAAALIFSRQAHVWEGLERARVAIIPPCIDPFAPKNRDMDDDQVDSILEQAALPNATRMVLQVSRWDRLKDPAGVLRRFADHTAGRVEARLVLAGPAVTSVDDDPEEPKVIEEVTSRWRSLPAPARDRIVIGQLPMEDVERNALMVNALQRKAEVVVQKSLAEGFGLTVAEAMG